MPINETVYRVLTVRYCVSATVGVYESEAEAVNKASEMAAVAVSTGTEIKIIRETREEIEIPSLTEIAANRQRVDSLIEQINAVGWLISTSS